MSEFKMSIEYRWVSSCFFTHKGQYFKRYLLMNDSVKYQNVNSHSHVLITDEDLIEELEKAYIVQCNDPETEKEYSFK